MDRDGTTSGYRPGADQGGGGRCRDPGDRLRWGRQLSHLVEGILEGHADAVLSASIFHYGHYSIAEAKAALSAAGIPVREVV